MRRIQQKFKEGAASFYIVAFSTLILVIIAASFAMVIIQAVTRASNEDLSQSAYDSALGGVEDARLAYMAYQKCVQGDTQGALKFTAVKCEDVINIFNNEKECPMVGRILGKITEEGETEVKIGAESSSNVETNNVNAINQAYTCVIVKDVLTDYMSVLNASNQTRTALIKFSDPADAAALYSIKLSWYTNSSDAVMNYNNVIKNNDGTRVAFQPLNKVQAAAPPTIELQMVQTASTFNFDQIISKTVDRTTDRATMYFVPSNVNDGAASVETSTYKGIYKDGKNFVDEDNVLNTNDPEKKNKPFLVACDSGGAYACSVEVKIPNPIGGNRNANTLAFAVSLPYGQPNTDFKIELLKEDSDKPIELKGTQIDVDSTGRTNDLYRRVDVRLEENVAELPFLHYALELLGGNGDDGHSLIKTMSVYPTN